MTIEQDLRTYLLGLAPIATLLGTRLYPARLPQGVTLPALTYQRIAGIPEVTYDGAANLSRARIQIDVWADSYGAMVELAKAIRGALSGYRGAMGSTSVTVARVLNEIDMPEPEPPLWRRVMDCAIWHRE